jgi:hypothetical protein
MRWTKAAVTGALAALLLLWGWYYESPRWTLRQMRSAALAHDTARLDAFVDYPALRASEAAQMRAAGAKLAAMAPPELRALVEADTRRRHTAAQADWRSSPEWIRRIFGREPTSWGWASGAPETGRRERIAVRSPDEFHVHDRDDRFLRPEGDLTFRRHGTRWKLVAIGPTPDELLLDEPPTRWERFLAGAGL